MLTFNSTNDSMVTVLYFNKTKEVNTVDNLLYTLSDLVETKYYIEKEVPPILLIKKIAF